jgi:hypothetical protein
MSFASITTPGEQEKDGKEMIVPSFNVLGGQGCLSRNGQFPVLGFLEHEVGVVTSQPQRLGGC